MRYVVSTVGTSILTNGLFGAEHEVIRSVINRNTNRRREQIDDEDLRLLDEHIANRRRNLFENTARPERLSAELNGILSLYEKQLGRAKGDVHLLLTSDTMLGRIMGEILVDWLREQGVNVSVSALTGLTTASLDEFRLGMNAMVELCEKEVQVYRKSGYHVVFNLVGGFKAMQAYAQTLGMLFADETVYIFDGEGAELLRIPKIPMAIDFEAIAREHKQVLRALFLGLPVAAESSQALPASMLEVIGDSAQLSIWGDIAHSKVSEVLYREELLAPPSERVSYGPKFLEACRKLPADRLYELNKRVDQICLYQQSNGTQNPRSLHVHPIHSPLTPEATHECYAWSDQAARRIYFRFDGAIAELLMLGDHLLAAIEACKARLWPVSRSEDGSMKRESTMSNTKRVMFCFLGTANYIPVKYKLNDYVTEKREQFTQCAILRSLGESRPQTLYVGLTDGARKHSNWADLQRELAQLGVSYIDVPLEEGFSEESLWNNFAEIGSALPERSEVIFDVTHGLRSLPIVAMLAIAFFANTRGLKVDGIYYGAFEVLGGPAAVAERFEKNEDVRPAPIFDLTAMYSLPQWAEAAAMWNRTGRAELFVELAGHYLKNIKQTMKQDAPQALTGLPQRIEFLNGALRLLRSDQIASKAMSVQELISSAKEQSHGHPALAPLNNVLSLLEPSLDALRADGSSAAENNDIYLRHQVELARWYRRHDSIAESYSVLRECITSAAARLVHEAGIEAFPAKGKSCKWQDAAYRGKAEWLLKSICSGERGDPSQAAYEELLSLYCGDNAELRRSFLKAGSKVEQRRNPINHCWTGDEHAREKFTATELSSTLKLLDEHTQVVATFVEKVIEHVQLASNATVIMQSSAQLPRECFLNISNHPSSTWSVAQREAAVALGFGGLMDLEGGVGEVDPGADWAEVEQLAERLAERAVAMGARGAHVMTEMTLTLALVRALQLKGIRCFASTSHRVSSCEEGAEGETIKHGTFRFVRFREYQPVIKLVVVITATRPPLLL